jgi:POT family proton-dependent oligopeptide transporter
LPPPLTTGLRWADAALGTVPAAEVFGVATVARLSPLILLLAPFWALFDAQGSIWTLQRVGMRTFCFAGGSGCLTTEQLGALNPLLVLVFVPLIGWLCEVLRARVARGVAPAWLEPTPLRRMSAGMLLTPVSFALTAAVQAAIDAAPAGTVSILWQVPQHVAITVAEVLVSATGLEWANKEAPASMTTSVVALYLGTVALGNVITGVLYSSLAGVLSSVQLILLLMALMCAAAGAFVALAATYVSLPAPAAAAAPSDDAGAAGEATSLLLTEAKGSISRQL